jgi:S1-C subfamily serine protease
MIESVMLAVTPVKTFAGVQPLTDASGFFFRAEDRLYLVSNRHVFEDRASDHFPDRVEILVHTDARDLTRNTVCRLPLYSNGLAVWRHARDTGGEVDVAVLEIADGALPEAAVVNSFDASDIESRGERVMVGDSLSVIGFPLGFHDTVHRLAVARNASIASAYGIRFQTQGYFLTDARTHRGSSGSPVLRRRADVDAAGTSSGLWQLLGVHSTRMDMRTRDATQDESLGLNCAWYADVIKALVSSSPG